MFALNRRLSMVVPICVAKVTPGLNRKQRNWSAIRHRALRSQQGKDVSISDPLVEQAHQGGLVHSKHFS